MAKTFNQSIQEAKGEIIIKTDYDSLAMSKNCIHELVANFSDPKVGGATGICVAKAGIEKYYRKVQTILQVAETNLDSTIIGHSASLLAFRKSTIAPVDPDSAAEDTEELILIRKQGYRTIIDKSVVSVEEVPTGFKARRIQRDRRAHGIIKALLQNRDILFNRRYGKFGLIIYPQLIFILTFSPIFLLAMVITLIYSIYTIDPSMFLLVPTGILLGFVIKPDLFRAVVDVHISGLVGTIRALRGKKDPVWRKVR